MADDTLEFPVEISGSVLDPYYDPCDLQIGLSATNVVVFNAADPLLRSAIVQPRFVDGTSPPAGWDIKWNQGTLTWVVITDNTQVELSYQAVRRPIPAKGEQEDDPVIRTGSG